MNVLSNKTVAIFGIVDNEMPILQPTIAASSNTTFNVPSMDFVYAVMMALRAVALLEICDLDGSKPGAIGPTTDKNSRKGGGAAHIV